MAFKINLSTKDGKTYKLEAEAPALKQHKLGDTIKGEEISEDLTGYELEIKGTTDFAGFIGKKGVQGIGLKGVLLGYGQGMHKRPKGEKKVGKAPKGLRLRKTVRGETISDAVTQVNIKVLKEGGKKLSEVFPDQNKAPEPEAPKEEPKEEQTETKPTEEKKEAKEEKPAETPSQEQAEKPVEEAKEAPNEAQPEQEPKESEASKEEKAHPEEEPK